MAPYLHNGSVPSLYALLLPAKDRPQTFHVGTWEFDPEHVGYETTGGSWHDLKDPRIPEGESVGAFTFDTRDLGNSNAGHEYGTDLSEDDRQALLEYLKTL